MAKRSHRARSQPRFLKLAILAVVGLALLWLALSTTGTLAFPRFAQAAELLDPNNPARFFAGPGAGMAQRELSDETRSQLSSALGRQPLAAEPFGHVAARIMAGGDLARGERLLLEARRREPRDYLIRLSLLDFYFRTNRVREAGLEASTVVTLLPQSGGLLVPLLTRQALAPRTSPVLVEAIGHMPLMQGVLYELLQRGTDPERVMQLAVRQPRPAPGEFPNWLSLAISKLIERGNPARARSLWLELVGRAGERNLPVFDPRFEGWAGPPPFNWTLAGGEIGSAERTSGPALDVSYPGRRGGVLASQTLVLSPGRYRFSVRAEGNANGQGSRLAWRILCGEGAALLELPVTGITYTPRELSGEFTVSGACRTQSLRLEGTPGEFPTTQAARISDLSIRPLGGR